MSTPKTPANWHWKITPKDVAEIKLGNRETINRVYFDNYDHFKFFVVRLIEKKFGRDFSYVEDFLQQIYVDLPKYDYTNSLRFWWSIYTRFYYLKNGRKSVRAFSYENKDGDTEGWSLFDTLVAPEEKTDEERIEENAAALRLIENQKQLTERARDILMAEAFGCIVYRGLYENAKKEIYAKKEFASIAN